MSATPQIRVLPLQDLASRHLGVTEPIASCYLEAARVCLSRHHISPVLIEIFRDASVEDVQVEWSEPDARTLRAWANEIDTTEAGAYGCVIAATELIEGLVTVARAETETGADYYIAPPGHIGEDLEDCLRLEVSGTDRGSAGDVRRLLRQKVEQALRGDSNLPALAGVIGFRVRKLMLEMVEPVP